MMAAWTANAQNSPYIAHVYDYLPAPGQFVNQSPSYKPGYTQDSINALVETSLCGKSIGGTISLGSFGGYIVFGFDHPVVNKHGYDVKIYGNAIQSQAVPDQLGGSCEPGIIMVGVDVDGDGVPSNGDKWYEIKGSDYDRCQHGFEVTYYKPDEDKVKVPHEKWSFINDIEYVHWTSNDASDPEGSSTISSMCTGPAMTPVIPRGMSGATPSITSLTGPCGGRKRSSPSGARGCPIPPST